MKLYDKLYVGFQKQRYNDTEDQRMLGFATPIDDTAAYQKRKSTVDQWREKSIPTIELENKPRYGFKIIDTIHRYQGNKLFRIEDPAGFEIEISADNLFEIILECAIVKGAITDPLVYVRNGAQNDLISANSNLYKDLVSPAKSAAHISGAWMKHRTGNVYYRYEGKFHFVVMKEDTNIDYPRKALRGYYHWNNRFVGNDIDHLRPEDVKTSFEYTIDRSRKEPVIVYTEWRLNDDGEFHKKPHCIHVRKSKFKDLVEVTDQTVPEYEFKINNFYTANRQYIRGVEDFEVIESTLADSWDYKYYAFVNDINDRRSFTRTLDELKLVYDPLEYITSSANNYNRLTVQQLGTINWNVKYKDESKS